MVVFTDESAQGNPGPVENGIVISKQGLAGKFLKTCKGSSLPIFLKPSN